MARKTSWWTIGCTVLLLLVACGGETQMEPEAAAPAGTEQPLPTARPVEDGAEQPTGETVEHAPVVPGVVDLSNIEEEEMAGERNSFEAPKPGIPNPMVRMTERARQALASRLDVPVENVTVVDGEEVTWSSTALGCPAPDMFYAQMMTPGYRIILEADGERYRYHTDQNEHLVLCSDEGHPLD